MSLIRLLRRAFTSNLRSVSLTDGERATLQAAGIHEPAVQRYVAWRRGMVVMVLIATVLGAGLSTYRELTESDQRPTPFSALGEKLLEGAEGVKSAAKEEADDAPADPKATAADFAATAKQLAKEANNATGKMLKPEIADKLRAKAAAVGKTAAKPTGQDEDEDDEDDEEEKGQATVFGRFADSLHLLAFYAFPLAAVAVLCCWTRLRLSFQILLAAWVLAFFTPMLVALCPWSWWGFVEPPPSPAQDAVRYFQRTTEGIVEGAEYLIMLLPTVLSIIPGVQRACLRVKSLLPEAMLPGWLLVAASPLYALFLLVFFVAIDQVVGDWLLLVGMVLLVAAPLVYVVHAGLFTSPLSSEEDCRAMRRVQRLSGGLAALAGVLLLGFVSTRQIFGIHMIGNNPATSLLAPVDVVEYVLEFLGRLMFMTVFGADIVMRINLSNWKKSQAFASSEQASSHNQTMAAAERALGRGQDARGGGIVGRPCEAHEMVREPVTDNR